MACRGRSGATALLQAIRQRAPHDVLELMLSSESAPEAAKESGGSLDIGV